MENKKKWTIIFLVYAFLENRTWNPKIKILRELQSLYQDITTAEQSDEIEIFLIYNRVIKNPSFIDTTYLLKLSFDPVRKRMFLKKIDRYCENNVAQDPKELRKVLQFVRTQSLSNHYILFTWGHGSVWDILSQDRNLTALNFTSDIENEALNWRNALAKEHQERYHVLLEDCQNLVQKPTIYTIRDILSNDELAESIAYGFPSPHILDILVMMNCDMMNINCCYSLRQCVNILIAPEGTIDEPGYNYYEIISKITRFPHISPENLAKVIVNSIPVRRERDYPYLDDIEKWAVFAFSMKSYFKTFIIVDYLAELLSDFMKQDIEVNPHRIRNIVRRCFPFDAGNLASMIDLHNCLVFLYDELKISDFKSLDSELQNTVNEAVIARHVGINLYRTWQRRYSDNVNPCGVAIYFPRDRSMLLPENFHTFIAPDARLRSSYFSNTKWFEFICLYLRLIN